MIAPNRKEPLLLLLGDLLAFTLSLWLALLIRFGRWPSWQVFEDHLLPFGILFLFWCLVFFIAGLYEKHTVIFKKRLPLRVWNVQIFNSLLAIVFFYFIPYLGITPKVTLFIYIIVAAGLVSLWRIYGQEIFGLKSQEKAFIVGRNNPDTAALNAEIKDNPRYGLELVGFFDLNQAGLDLKKEVVPKAAQLGVTVIIIDRQAEALKGGLAPLYSLLFSRIRFVDFDRLYEEVFDRIPPDSISYDWFLENVSLTRTAAYDFLKRSTDIIASAFLGLLSLALYLPIGLAIKINDGGSVFISQERVGRNNRPIRIWKFRTMSFNDDERKEKRHDNKITRVGYFLRRSRLDELPQLWSVLVGDLSLIGPRPELPALAEVYEREVPYYNIRHLVKPGLSGWAQLYHDNHPHQGADVEETRNKLSYDLYYMKNRSLGLDFKIALKTIKALLLRTGK